MKQSYYKQNDLFKAREPIKLQDVGLSVNKDHPPPPSLDRRGRWGAMIHSINNIVALHL